MKPLVIVLIGLPAAGKSTLAQKIKVRGKEEFPGYLWKIIDPDKIRTQVMGNHFQPGLESKVTHLKFQAIQQTIKESNAAIFDDVHYYTSMRHDILQISKIRNAVYYSIFISASIEFCINNNNSRGNPIPNSVIKDIASKFDTPGSKYRWDTPDIILYPEQQPLFSYLPQIFRQIKLKLESSVLSNQEHTINHASRSATKSQISLKQNLDLEIRHLFTHIIQKTIDKPQLNELASIFHLNPSSTRWKSNMGNQLSQLKSDFLNWLMKNTYLSVSIMNFIHYLHDSFTS